MVSLIITVRNERQTLPHWLESIQQQTRQPNEIVIVDGGSADGTWEWLQEIRLPTVRVFKEIGNISYGRNKAIGHAKGEIIVVTDAGCIYHPTWLENMVAALINSETDFVSSAFGPWLKDEDPLLTYGIAAATIPRRGEFHKGPWLASSRSVAFNKKVWEKVGGYPEWIPYCEDVIFDLKIAKAGLREMPLNKTLVFWRPRTTLGGFWRQLYNYTRSDAHGKLFYRRQTARYFVYSALLAIIIAALLGNWQLLLIPAVLAPFYINKFLMRWFSFTRQKKLLFRLSGLVIVPLLIFYGDLAKMWGWYNGVRERRRKELIFQPW